MTSPLSLPVVASSATPPAPSSRDAQARSGENFGAALARSRSSNGSQAGKSDETQGGASGAQGSRRKSVAASADSKEHSPAELLAIALLTPAFLASAPRAAAHDAPRGAAAASGTAPDVPAPLSHELLAAAGSKPFADVDGAGAPAVEAQAAQGDAQKAGHKAPGTAGRTDAGKPEALAAKGAEGATSTSAAAPAALLPAAASSPTAPTPVPGTGGDAAKAAATPVPSPTAIVQQAADATAASQPDGHEDVSLASAATPSSATGTPSQPLPGLAPAMAVAVPTQPAPAAPVHVPLLTVAPLVGSDEWGAAVGQQMIRMNASGEHVAELNLNPAGLGPLKISLTLGDNQAQAMFVSAHESVRKAIEAALPQLRSQLADQGISLGQASVDAGTQQHQQHHAAGRDSDLDTPAAMPRASTAPRPVAADAMPGTRAEHTRTRSGSVDTFA